MSGPRPSPRITCLECGNERLAKLVLPHGPICARCAHQLHYHRRRCPSCDVIGVIAYINVEGTKVCANCAGHVSHFTCPECGSEAHPYGVKRCARCVLRERLTALMTDPTTGRIHDRLTPVFDTLVGGPRPQTAIYWLRRRQRIGPDLLAQMARGEMEISHQSFNALPMDRTHNYVRDLLVAVGVLGHYETFIERMVPWLATLGEPLNTHHAQIIDQFARWKVLRQMRRHADRGRLTKGVLQSSRLRLRRVVALLVWLEERGRSIETTTQSDLDQYLSAQPKSVTGELGQFLAWTGQTGLNRSLTVDSRSSSEPQVTMSDEDRWDHVNTLLHDESIRLHTRIAGLLMLLFAQPITTICAMRTEQINTSTPDKVLVTFEDTPIEMPEPLAELIRTHLSRRGQASYASRDNGWLFPGGIPGKPLVTNTIRGQLVDRGIRPHSARHAALFALSGQVPHMILAQTLGISQTAATRWAALAARDWDQYISQRAE